MTSVMLVQCSTNRAIKPTGSWPLCEFFIPVEGEEIYTTVYKLRAEYCGDQYLHIILHS